MYREYFWKLLQKRKMLIKLLVEKPNGERQLGSLGVDEVQCYNTCYIHKTAAWRWIDVAIYRKEWNDTKTWKQPLNIPEDHKSEDISTTWMFEQHLKILLQGHKISCVLLKERKWHVQHNYLLLYVVESYRLHVSTLHAGHLQAFTRVSP